MRRMSPRVVLSMLNLAIAPLTLGAQQTGTRSASNSLPSISPDGAHILFLSDRDSTNSVFVIAADGGGERQVTHGGAGRARWSADGREIEFAGEGPDTGRVFAIAAEGGKRRVVATVVGRSPVLSPDGKLVAYLVGPWTSTAIAVASAAGSGAKVIAGGRTTAWNPAWSPDGKRIAYTYGDSSRVLQVHLVNADGTGDRAVTHVAVEEGSAQVPSWSPDGRRLAIQVSNGRSHSAHIWIVDLETGAAQQLGIHAEPYLDEAPTWFPDGKHIAFQSNRSGRMEIWVMKDDGTVPLQVTGAPRQEPKR
jgi:TolB protein